MTYLPTAVLKNLKRTWTSPWSLAIWAGVPLLVGTLLGAVMGGESGPSPRVHLLVEDEDGSFLSRSLTRTFAADQLAEMVLLEPVTREAGAAIIDRGDATAMLVVPSGFQSRFLRSEPQSLNLIVNALQSILPDMAEELTRLLVDAGGYAQSAFGAEHAAIDDIADGLRDEQPTGDVTEAAQRLAVDVLPKLARALPLLGDGAIEVEVVTTDGAAKATFLLLFFPGLLMMTVIFAAQGLAEDL